MSRVVPLCTSTPPTRLQDVYWDNFNLSFNYIQIFLVQTLADHSTQKWILWS